MVLVTKVTALTRLVVAGTPTATLTVEVSVPALTVTAMLRVAGSPAVLSVACASPTVSVVALPVVSAPDEDCSVMATPGSTTLEASRTSTLMSEVIDPSDGKVARLEVTTSEDATGAGVTVGGGAENAPLPPLLASPPPQATKLAATATSNAWPKLRCRRETRPDEPVVYLVNIDALTENLWRNKNQQLVFVADLAGALEQVAHHRQIAKQRDLHQ